MDETFLDWPDEQELANADELAVHHWRTDAIPGPFEVDTLRTGFRYLQDGSIGIGYWLLEFNPPPGSLHDWRQYHLAVVRAWGERFGVNVDPILVGVHGEHNDSVFNAWGRLRFEAGKLVLDEWKQPNAANQSTANRNGKAKKPRPLKNAKLVEFAKLKRDEGLSWKEIATAWNRDHFDNRLPWAKCTLLRDPGKQVLQQ